MRPGGPRNVELMKMGSEQHASFFKTFCRQNNINLNHYEMVIGNDLHSGGTGRQTVQMVLLYKNAGYTTLHGDVLMKMQMVEKNGAPQRIIADPTLIVGGPNTTPGAQVLRSMLASPNDRMDTVQTIRLERAALGAQTQ